MDTNLQPLLSIVIVAYKSLSDLQQCLPSLHKAGISHLSYQLIIIDNYGLDDIKPWIIGAYPEAEYYLNKTNTGYAGGNNVGIQKAKGQWTLLLNPDTELHSHSLIQLMRTAQAFPAALINPKLLNPDGTINACGNQMHYTGITTCRGLNEPSEKYKTLEEIPLLSGAALLAPTHVLTKLGGFDERYFMYFEDTDLSLRARLLGHTLLCDSQAVVTHHYKLGMNPVKFGYLERNRLMTLTRALSRSTLLALLPALLLIELITWAYATRGWLYMKSRLTGYAWLWRHRQQIARQRQAIQRTRRINDAELLKDSLSSLPFSQLVSGTAGRVLNKIFDLIFKVLRPWTLSKKS